MEFNLSDMIFAVLNFAVMAAVLTKLLYKPVFRILDQRKAQLADLQAGAQADRLAAQAELETARAAVQSARQEAVSLLESAQQEGLEEKNALLAQAKQSGRALTEAARAELAREQANARLALRDEVAVLSIEMTRHLVERTLDDTEDARLMESFLDALDAPDSVALLSHPAAAQEQPVVRTARALSPEQQAALTQKLSAVLERPVTTVFLTDVSILGGLSLQLGDYLMDGSLSGQITRLQRELVG
ncbi:MAG: F0F1 ATP synthase subunit B [Oscillibacter sp.]